MKTAHTRRYARAAAPFALVLAACSGDETSARPAAADGALDASAADAAPDAPLIDAPSADTSSADAARDAADPIPGSSVTYTEQRAPCADRTPVRRALFGDLHVHTALSFDAYIFEVRATPTDAYDFARGAAIGLAPLDPGGEPMRSARLDRPLDFAAVTDHAEFLAETDLCSTPGSPSYDALRCRIYRRGGGGGSISDLLAFASFGQDLGDEMPERNAAICGPDNTICLTRASELWGSIREAAEIAYDRSESCTFTSFIGYENTATTNANNLHRNVIFRNAEVPALPLSYYEAPSARALWDGLRAQCDAASGCQVLTIPHNSNGSGGEMFEVEYEAQDAAGQRAEAERRSIIEPLMEIYQHKGASECSLAWSTDEECAFEFIDSFGSFGAEQAPRDFLRGALQEGLAESARIGANPLRLGVIASTDTHNATPGAVSERAWGGHAGTSDADALRESNIDFSPGGLVGVWAVENSRDAIFEAMARRETFGTSGPRITPRLFGGFGLDDAIPSACDAPDLLERGYRDGVPMGGTLAGPAPAGAPSFVAQAMADEVELGALQIIKVWVDPVSGERRERIIDVALSGGEASVNASTCAREGTPGEAVLCGTWTDDSFDAAVPTAYYARALQDPTCRWNARLCAELAPTDRPRACRDREAVSIVRERAWTSPIFYEPGAP